MDDREQGFLDWLGEAQINHDGRKRLVETAPETLRVAYGGALSPDETWVPWSPEPGDEARADSLAARGLIFHRKIPRVDLMELRLELTNPKLKFASKLTHAGWDLVSEDLRRRWSLLLLGGRDVGPP